MNCIEADNIIYMEDLLTIRESKMSEEMNATTDERFEPVENVECVDLEKELNETKASLEECKKANTALKTNIDNLNMQFKNTFENLMNELDASKQMYNESLNAHYQLRTANIALQKKIQGFTQEIAQLKESLVKKD